MNVLDYSIKLGKRLAKTEEGQRLIQLEENIESEYKDNLSFRQYMNYAEQESSLLYFYAWDKAYKVFENVLHDDTIEHRALFLPTSHLIISDPHIKVYSQEAVSFGNLFEKIVSVCISDAEINQIIPASWKYKVKNAISNVQIAVERTLLMRSISAYHQKNPNFLDNPTTKKYLQERESKVVPPFSDTALQLMDAAPDVPEAEKILYEKMRLVMEVVKKGIFYGFWGIINEIYENELVEKESLLNAKIGDVEFIHINNLASIENKGWLYKIHLNDKYVYLLAHSKTVRFSQEDQTTTVTGIVYPSDDRGFFQAT